MRTSPSPLTEYEQALAERIAYHRRGQNITQAALAERAGMHVNTYGYIERKERPMTMGELVALADAIDKPVETLLTEAGITGRRDEGRTPPR